MTKKLIAIVAFILATTATLQAQEIKWMTFDQAIAAQKKKPKKIFIDVYTNWCGPCKMLANNTFKNKDLVNYVNDNYYAVKLILQELNRATHSTRSRITCKCKHILQWCS